MLNLALTPVSSSDLKSMRRSERIHQVRRPCSHGARLHKWQQQLLLMEQCSDCNHVLLHDFQKVASDFHHFSTSVSLNFFISWSNASAQWLLLCALGSRHWLDHCEGPKLDDMLRFVWKMTRKSLKKDAVSCDLSLAKYTWRMTLVAWSVTMHLWFQNLRVDSSDGSDWDFSDARKGANKI